MGERLADHDGGRRERAVHVALAAAALEEHVGAVLGVQARRARIERGGHVGHRGQRVVRRPGRARSRPRRRRAWWPRPPPPARRRSARARSAARARRSRRSRAPRGAARAGPTTPSRSRPVSTSTTPAAARAAAVSTAPSSAWACSLRTKAACSRPGSVTSSRKRPRPRQQAGILHPLDVRAQIARWRRGQELAPHPARSLSVRGLTASPRGAAPRSASSSSWSIPQVSGFSTMYSQPPRLATLARIFSASSSASPRR